MIGRKEEEKGIPRSPELMPSLIIFTSERMTWRNPSLSYDWMEAKWLPGDKSQNKAPICPKGLCVHPHMVHLSLYVYTHTLVIFRGCCSGSDWSTLVKLADQETYARQTIFSRQTSRQRHLRYVGQVIWLETLDRTDSYIQYVSTELYCCYCRDFYQNPTEQVTNSQQLLDVFCRFHVSQSFGSFS